MDYNSIIKDVALYLILAAFMAGMLITAITGAAKGVKHLLFGLSALFFVLIAAGFVFSRGLLIFLLFQILALILGIYIVIVVGAGAGAVIHAVLYNRRSRKTLKETELGEYLPSTEFALAAGMPEERVIARISSGFYRGGSLRGKWYVHKTELASFQATDTDAAD
ncbi:MAG: hypothetical protein RLZZ227_323 [Pseudomonadota bacterium]|jgi:hypothetical protein